MNKHQTMIYLKYGNFIKEINDEIKDSAIKSDMIKFLNIIPGKLIYPNMIYYMYSENHGRFKFEITESSKLIYIEFDGNNNFRIYPYNKWPYNYSDFFIWWASIDNIDHYITLYPTDFNDIIK